MVQNISQIFPVVVVVVVINEANGERRMRHTLGPFPMGVPLPRKPALALSLW